MPGIQYFFSKIASAETSVILIVRRNTPPLIRQLGFLYHNIITFSQKIPLAHPERMTSGIFTFYRTNPDELSLESLAGHLYNKYILYAGG